MPFVQYLLFLLLFLGGVVSNRQYYIAFIILVLNHLIRLVLAFDLAMRQHHVAEVLAVLALLLDDGELVPLVVCSSLSGRTWNVSKN